MCKLVRCVVWVKLKIWLKQINTINKMRNTIMLSEQVRLCLPRLPVHTSLTHEHRNESAPLTFSTKTEHYELYQISTHCTALWFVFVVYLPLYELTSCWCILHIVCRRVFLSVVVSCILSHVVFPSNKMFMITVLSCYHTTLGCVLW